jgi:hypothetical protein
MYVDFLWSILIFYETKIMTLSDNVCQLAGIHCHSSISQWVLPYPTSEFNLIQQVNTFLEEILKTNQLFSTGSHIIQLYDYQTE